MPQSTPWIAKKETLDALRNRSVFLGNSDRRGFGHFISRFRRRHVKPGERIVTQGESTRSYYVIESGLCDVIVRSPRPCVPLEKHKEGEPVKSKKECAGTCIRDEMKGEGDESLCAHVRRTLREYDTFGEYAIMYSKPRAASVVAKGNVILWEISGQDLDEFLNRNPEIQEFFNQRRRIRRAISRVHWFLGSVDDEAKMAELIDACSVKHIKAGDIVVQQGRRDSGDFYVVEEGEMEVLVSKERRPPAFVACLGPGDSFGELALLNRDSRRNATVKASKDSVLLTITKTQFHRLARASCNALWKRFESCASVVQNGERFMTMTDLGKGLGGSGERSRAIELLFQAADQNQNHLVSWSEFVLLNGFLHRSDAEFQLAFLFCDVDGDGVISRDEFRQAMLSLVKHQKGISGSSQIPLPLDTKEVNDLFGDSRYLSYSEFMDHNRQRKLSAVIDMWEHVISEVQESSEDLMVSAMDTGEFVVMPGPGKPIDITSRSLIYLLCGGTAGAFSRLSVAPLIRVKMLMQTQTDGAVTGIIQGLRFMYKQDGWRGGFKGAGTNTIRIVPTTALQFLFFETLKSAIGQGDELTVSERLLAGGFAGIGAAIATYPLDFIRARLTVQSSASPAYKGIIHGISHVTKSEGPRALYRGLWPTCLGVFPYIGIDFAIYETLKQFVPYEADSDHRSVTGLLACGGIAGLVSQTVAFPLELVRRRLQTQGFGGADYGYNGGVYHALRTTVQHDGFRGLYRGLTANYVKAVPSIGISFVVYERMKHWLVNQYD